MQKTKQNEEKLVDKKKRRERKHIACVAEKVKSGLYFQRFSVGNVYLLDLYIYIYICRLIVIR